MNLKEAKEILGDRAHWKLLNMKRALSLFQMFNSEEDKIKLEAVKILLKEKK